MEIFYSALGRIRVGLCLIGPLLISVTILRQPELIKMYECSEAGFHYLIGVI